MARTTEELGARDHNAVGPANSVDRMRWIEKLGVSPAALQNAIDAVGANPREVERFLRERAEPPRYT